MDRNMYCTYGAKWKCYTTLCCPNLCQAAIAQSHRGRPSRLIPTIELLDRQCTPEVICASLSLTRNRAREPGASRSAQPAGSGGPCGQGIQHSGNLYGCPASRISRRRRRPEDRVEAAAAGRGPARAGPGFEQPEDGPCPGPVSGRAPAQRVQKSSHSCQCSAGRVPTCRLPENKRAAGDRARPPGRKTRVGAVN